MDVTKALHRYLPASLVALAAGLALAFLAPTPRAVLEPLVWPLIALAVYTMGARLNWGDMKMATDARGFVRALVLTQAVAIPLVATVLLLPLPRDPTLYLTLLLVLLAPSTYWLMTFSHIGGGSVQLASLAAPWLLVGQFILVPVWLLLLAPQITPASVAVDQIAVVFAALILPPLLLALLLERLGRLIPALKVLNRTAPRFTPALAVALLFLLAATHGTDWVQHWPLAGWAAVVVILHALLMLALGWLAGRTAGLSPVATRTLVFSLVGRNVLVALPFGLTLPDPALAAMLLSTCALAELVAHTVYARTLPRWLPDQPQASAPSKSG